MKTKRTVNAGPAKACTRTTLVAALLFVAALIPGTASAQGALPGPCEQGQLPSRALSYICVPAAGWNGDLVVLAPGYVAPNRRPDFDYLTLPDGTFLPAVIQGLGYAFATTSYRQSGLAILEGQDDVRELVAAFIERVAHPQRTHLAGLSEGGLVVTLLAERSPELFSSAMAACAPIGSFTSQLNYVGDFRVLFDYFFPGLLPGSPIDIPKRLINNWEDVYVPRVLQALAARPDKALELMRTSKAAYDPANPATIANTTISVLRYNVLGTNDANAKLRGNPFGNALSYYYGSSDDFRLNRRVARFVASPRARAALRAYQTDGRVGIPLVTLHTIGDEAVPFVQELLYLAKASPIYRGKFLPLPIVRYGHCNFTTQEILGAFALAVQQP